MRKDILMIGDIKIEKNEFSPNKTSIFLKDVDIKRVLVCSKISFGKKNYKYFIVYLHNDDQVNPLNIMLPKTSSYGKSYDRKTKSVYFLIEYDD